ncbi:MAG: serine hydrolase [Gemmatimonadetes bacterium]|nr:serine hydrolase [Gemmatimonadota bacterium]
MVAEAGSLAAHWLRAVAACLALSLLSCQTATVTLPAPTADRDPQDDPGLTAELDAEGRAWVERTLARLSIEELAGQIIIEWIPGGFTAPSSPDFEPLRRWVADDRIGGVSPSIGSPHAYVAKLNALQAVAEVPLLVTADFENGGPGMRINGSYALPSMLPQGGGTDFPPTMAFGAIGDERFAYEYGRITAREARASGVHLLFAPVLDVNSNPDNPVIATRSFGGDAALVARLGAAFVRGARDGGAFTTGKHFPGHGDTSTDSHTGIPVVEADRARLDEMELVPFAAAIREGVDAIMTAHVQLPAVLGPAAPPATLSPEVMTGILRTDLGFDGLLLTDALTMRGITDMYGIGEASVRSIEAGADVVLSPKAVTEALEAILEAVGEGRLTRSRLEESVRRLLVLKARVGLHKNRFVSLERVDEVVGSGAHVAFADTAATRSITLVRDVDQLVPMDAGSLAPTLHLRYAPSMRLWADRAFAAGLAERVFDLAVVNLDERSDSAAYAAATRALADADRVIVSAYVSASAGSGESALPDRLRELVAESARVRPTVLLSFGNPYLLAAVPDVGSYLLAWGDRDVPQRAALSALFGEEAISGRLPIPLPPFHDIGHGLDRAKMADRAATLVVDDPLVAAGIVSRDSGARGRSQTVADPGTVGMSATRLAAIDSIIRTAIADSAASGAAVAIGRRGRLVALRGYGELQYGTRRPVTPTSLFDLASVSKVVGTTTAAMMLVGDGLLDLDAPVVSYLPWWSAGDVRKNDVTVRHLLLHRTGLIPFRTWYFEMDGMEAYKAAAAAEPLEMPPGERTAYSDIGIMTLAWVIEEISGQSLDDFLQERLWNPLGMLETRYRPDASLRPRIAATEVDTIWRNEMVWGTVHDENADAMGGVAGHAGLFSTAVDLSVFARMMLNRGVAVACAPDDEAGEPCPVRRRESIRLLDADVLDMFTTRFDGTSSRALGWDTPTEGSSGGDLITNEAFGHTGYTGTSIWMDPELDLWVVLLTNRVHPTRSNQKHVPLRRAVQDAAVLAITDRPISPRVNR